MQEFIITVYKAYAIGAGCSAGVVALAKYLPLDDQVRKILKLVLPIPPSAIALVMMTCGSKSTTEFELTYGQGNLPLEMFFVGLATGPLAAATLLIIELIKRAIQAKMHGR
jgi:hypothetical protein